MIIHSIINPNVDKCLLQMSPDVVIPINQLLSGCVFSASSYLGLKNTIVHSHTNQIKCIYKALLSSADISKCCTETQPKTPNSKQCTVARKNSLERPEPRKKPREEPGYEGWPVLFWLCRVEIITEHGQDFQMFIDDQQQHGQVDWGQQGVIRPGSPEAWS